jgi:hypothetical protein
LWANTSGCSFASSTVLGSSGQSGATVGVAGLLENCPPPLPAAGEQPQTVDEHYRGKPGSVCPFDLVLFVFADVCHDCSLFLRSRGMRPRAVGWLWSCASHGRRATQMPWRRRTLAAGECLGGRAVQEMPEGGRGDCSVDRLVMAGMIR